MNDLESKINKADYFCHASFTYNGNQINGDCDNVIQYFRTLLTGGKVPELRHMQNSNRHDNVIVPPSRYDLPLYRKFLSNDGNIHDLVVTVGHAKKAPVFNCSIPYLKARYFAPSVTLANALSIIKDGTYDKIIANDDEQTKNLKPRPR